MEWRRSCRDKDNTLVHCGQKTRLLLQTHSAHWLTGTGGTVSPLWGVNGHNISQKKDAARKTTCVPNASWKLIRVFAVYQIPFSTLHNGSFSDRFLEDLSFIGCKHGRGQPRYDSSMQFRPMNGSCFSTNSQETCPYLACCYNNTIKDSVIDTNSWPIFLLWF